MDTHSPFKRLQPVEPDSGFESRVIARVAAAVRARLARRLAAASALAVASAGGLAAAVAYIWDASASSGLGDFLSFMFSDTAAALSYSKELGLSILESLPALGIALALSAALVLGWSAISAAGIIKRRKTYSYA
ncbi:MAG TPA: hypothetical protein VFQ72_01270 [Candidatus Paceibacterota bacterium]|nr:hypothetical protein [Candidatus Paceibacterota bacterium]